MVFQVAVELPPGLNATATAYLGDGDCRRPVELPGLAFPVVGRIVHTSLRGAAQTATKERE